LRRSWPTGQILIRNLDDSVIDALKRRVADHATSTEEEARRALTAIRLL
jgi:plasmid stability protein